MIVARKLTQRYSRASHVSEGASADVSDSGRAADSVLTVLDGVDLEIRAGEVVVILGPSGSGKTTLLGLLAGLDRPSDGSVRLAGIELESLDEDGRAAMRAERIGFIFQSFHLIPTLTALENVLVPLELLPANRAPKPAEAAETARGLLDRVGLAVGEITTQPNFPVANNSVSGSRAPSPINRQCSLQTNRRGTSIVRRGKRS